MHTGQKEEVFTEKCRVPHAAMLGGFSAVEKGSQERETSPQRTHGAATALSIFCSPNQPRDKDKLGDIEIKPTHVPDVDISISTEERQSGQKIALVRQWKTVDSMKTTRGGH